MKNKEAENIFISSLFMKLRFVKMTQKSSENVEVGKNRSKISSINTQN